ncbi:hypothetical protein ACJ3XI_03115 [Litorimonas sp. RW-G-Af-16]|uniref:hypothetical protein n=1 Tax=Litorimonas sp. RW-G-Af-16 TaxID=3241168 RepID=UPI00390C4852
MRFFKKTENKSAREKREAVKQDLADAMAEQADPSTQKENLLDTWRQLEAEAEALNTKLDDTSDIAKDHSSDADQYDVSQNADTPSRDTAMNFLQDSASDYREPRFSANLGQKTERIDVSPLTNPHTNTASQMQAERETTKALDVKIPSAFTREEGADLNAMRLDVARISADIQSGEELYRRAQKRIENLTAFVERAEVDFSLLNRLEPENRRLKARNRTLEAEITDKLRKVQILEADLENHQRRLSERNAVFDEVQGKLALATNSLREFERMLKTARENGERSALAAERAENSLDVEKRENEILRQKLVEMSVSFEEKQSGYIEAKKVADSLAVDAEEFRQTAQGAQSENIDLRNALDHAQLQNNQMKGEMVTLHEEIRNFKTQYEFNMIAREDEIIAMQGKIDALQKQLDIKDEIVRNAARDVTELRKIRTAQDLERERLESTITQQAYQLDQAQSELLKTKQDVTDFDRRYRDVATALTVSQARRSSSPPAETPDIQPAPRSPGEDQFAPLTERADYNPDEFSDLSDDDIMDQVTEFKLGLRNDIG